MKVIPVDGGEIRIQSRYGSGAKTRGQSLFEAEMAYLGELASGKRELEHVPGWFILSDDEQLVWEIRARLNNRRFLNDVDKLRQILELL